MKKLNLLETLGLILFLALMGVVIVCGVDDGVSKNYNTYNGLAQNITKVDFNDPVGKVLDLYGTIFWLLSFPVYALGVLIGSIARITNTENLTWTILEYTVVPVYIIPWYYLWGKLKL